MPSGAPATDRDIFAISDDEVDRLLEAHSGDPRATVRDLALSVAKLEREVSGLKVDAAEVSTISVYRMHDAPMTREPEPA